MISEKRKLVRIIVNKGGKYKKLNGFSLVELLVVVNACLVIMLVLASALDVVWMHYKHMNWFNRVDNQLVIVDNFIRRGIINSGGGFYWMPVGGLSMLYMYNHIGASSIVVEGKKVNNDGIWIKVEDTNLFIYALMEGGKYVNFIGDNGIKVGKVSEIDKEGNQLKVVAINNNEFWVNRGDIIEVSRTYRYAEVRNGKMWIEGLGYVADGIVAFDIMYEKGSVVGYGVVEIPNPAEGLVVCNYDADNDGQLTIKDDIDGDGILDCKDVEDMEVQKFDAIQYWILAALPKKEAKQKNSVVETFVVGRKVYNIDRSRYPRLLTRKINMKGFEI